MNNPLVLDDAECLAGDDRRLVSFLLDLEIELEILFIDRVGPDLDLLVDQVLAVVVRPCLGQRRHDLAGLDRFDGRDHKAEIALLRARPAGDTCDIRERDPEVLRDIAFEDVVEFGKLFLHFLIGLALQDCREVDGIDYRTATRKILYFVAPRRRYQAAREDDGKGDAELVEDVDETSHGANPRNYIRPR